MVLLQEGPKEIEKDKFDKFIEEILTNHPVDEFPEVFIYYQEIDDKILVLKALLQKHQVLLPMLFSVLFVQ